VGDAVADFEHLRDSGLLDELVRKGALLPVFDVDSMSARQLATALPPGALLVRQLALPFVSYPYEWPFGMLQAAALLHLDLIESALDHDLMVKDASAYNIQFDGTHPVFIDLGSFERYAVGRPWRGYAQFCNLFLNPLLIDALAQFHFQPWLRSSLEGIPADVTGRMLPIRAKVRRGVFLNVVLQALLGSRFRSATPAELGVTPNVKKRSIIKNVRHLRELVSSLRVSRTLSSWTDYEDTNSYSAEARSRKSAFVDAAVASARPAVVWDIGSNQGEYAFIAARHAKTVVAIDADAGVVERLYQRARDANACVLPLVMDLRNPSPDQGWDQRERGGLASRGPADIVLALAIVHHLRLGGNVPLRLLVRWLARIGRSCVVEFVPKSDPQVRRLLAWRDDVYDDYDESGFEAALSESFAIEEKCRLPDSGRVLYSARAR